jgi:Mg-chelatase subunit ChlD
MEIDFKQMDSEPPDRRHMLVLAAVAVSAVVHVGLMLGLSDRAFVPAAQEAKFQTRTWTKNRPVMQVKTVPPDSFDKRVEEIIRPAAAPDDERPEERVDRLAGATAQGVLPTLPAVRVAEPASSSAPPKDPVPDAAVWQPRQEIVTIETPTVPDEAAALPRVVIPKIPRTAQAADLTAAAVPPPMALPPPTAPQTAPKALTDQAWTGLAAPPSLSLPRPDVSGLLGGKERPPAVAAEEDRKEGAARTKPDAQALPVLPAPLPTARVDVKKVETEKEAVRALRDEQVETGEPFQANVQVALDAWIDPGHPQFKYFRVRLASRPDNALPVIAKDVVFLLDASGSIGRDRLRSCRKALSGVLRQLNTGDRFNVVAFRDKFSYAFTDVAWREASEAAFEAADDWLWRQSAHGQTDVFATLRGVLAMPRDPARPMVVFVVTDGEATRGLTRNAEIITRFSALNEGLVSVYMYGVKETANAYLMDMLTRCNRGGWARNSGSRWRTAEGLAEFSARFAKPVLSDVSVLFASASRAETYPRLVTNLCEGEPIEIYGVCPADQDELVFRVRGLNGKTACENLFRLPFSAAGTLNADVRKAWATRRVYEWLAAYVMNPKPETLRDMRIFAKHYGIQIPYEKEMR